MVMRVRTRVAPSPIHGLGLFAVDPIPQGTLVWEWDEGVDLRLPMSAREGATGPLRDLLTTHAWAGEGALWLPADGARHVNHSPAPNCAAGPGAAPSVALRDIAAGEELTEDYGLWDEEWRSRDWLGESQGSSPTTASTRPPEDWQALALSARSAATEWLKQLGAAEVRFAARVEEMQREHAARMGAIADALCADPADDLGELVRRLVEERDAALVGLMGAEGARPRSEREGTTVAGSGALESLRTELEVAHAFHDVAVRERDAARLRAQALELELEGLRARLQGESPSEAALAAMARLALTGSRA